MKKLIWLMVLVLLVVSISVVAYPKIDFRSVDKETQIEFIKVMKSIDEKHYDGVKKITVYRTVLYYRGGNMVIGDYIAPSFIRIFDAKLNTLTKKNLEHELTHHKCWKENRDLSHDSQCFTNGLD